jgi:membrane protease YdiL (CAAX protease family)
LPDPQPLDDSRRPSDLQPSPTSSRSIALLEILICSDYPTQFAVAGVLAACGIAPVGPGGRLRIGFIVALSLVDSAVLIGLILAFLYAHGERPRDLFLGPRPIVAEAIHGVPLVFMALLIGIAVLGSIQHFAPWLHTVQDNPLRDLIRSPRDAWLFALVVVVAGGIREELQRAFLLHRFEVWFGGGTVGVIVASAAFGLGHLYQGVDAGIATALLGAFWGIVYLRRRSVVAPMVSHSGFDLMQIAQFFVAGR